nr:hypothetical protein [Tanacetum cinerariifolium]
MSSGINLPSPQPGRAESIADRVHSRAVAAETQPKKTHSKLTVVDVPTAIIDVYDEDDDITDDEDVFPHDLADFDNEDLINVDDAGVDKMLPGPTAVTVEVRIAPSTMYPAVVWVALLTEPNLGGRAAGRLNTRDKTQNLSLKKITDTKGPVPIQFELRDKQTVMPLGDHAAHWSSYIGEVIRGVPLYYSSWLKVPKERKAALITTIGAAHRIHRLDRDQRRHPAALVKSVQYQQGCFQDQHWVIDPTTGTYNVEKIRRAHPENITASEWDKGRAQPLRSTRRSLTPSSWHTLLMANYFGMRTDVYTLSRVVPAGVASTGTTRRVPTIRTTRMRMAMAILSCVIYGSFPGDMSPGNMCHRGTNFLTGKYVGPTVSLGIVAEDGIPCERSPANIPWRQVAGETYPQRQVAGKSPELSLGNRLNVVVREANSFFYT